MKKYGNFKEVELTEHIPGDGKIITRFIENEVELEEYLSGSNKIKLVQYDLNDFIKDVEGILKGLREKEIGLDSLDLKVPYSYSLLNNVRLTYNVIRRGPGLFDNTSEPFAGVRNYRPVKRLVARDPRAKDYSVIANQMFFDNILQINAISKNYRNANEAAFFIEDFMERYRMVFLDRGLLHLRFMERIEDKKETENDIRTYICGVRFYVRTFKMYLTYEKDLEKINLFVKTNS